jgi:hypothetical protein
MIKVTILVPIKDNNGQVIDPNEVGSCLYSILELCGGYTRSEPNLTGVWKDDKGKLYFDVMFSVMVCCEDEKLPALREIAACIAKVCKQECLYFDYQPITLEFITPCAK